MPEIGGICPLRKLRGELVAQVGALGFVKITLRLKHRLESGIGECLNEIQLDGKLVFATGRRRGGRLEPGVETGLATGGQRVALAFETLAGDLFGVGDVAGGFQLAELRVDLGVLCRPEFTDVRVEGLGQLVAGQRLLVEQPQDDEL